MLLADIEGTDLCLAVFLLVAALWLGNAIARGDSRSRRIGLGAGALAFIAVVIRQLEIAPPAASADFVGLLIPAAVAGAVATGIGWCVAGPLADFHALTIAPLFQTARDWRRRLAERRCAATEAKRREADERKRQEEYERAAPERERQRQAAEEKRKADAEAQRRREAARANCEMVYALYAPEISNRFSKSDFQEFARKYLGDDRPAEQVEQRVEELIQHIERHLERIEPMRKFDSLESLAQWFSAQRRQLDAVDDERLKRSLLVRLNERYADLTSRLLEELQP